MYVEVGPNGVVMIKKKRKHFDKVYGPGISVVTGIYFRNYFHHWEKEGIGASEYTKYYSAVVEEILHYNNPL